jgi:hypothetical protein
METYSRNPTVRGIVEVTKALPIVGSIMAIFDASVLASLEQYREKQFQIFLDEIASSGLNPDVPIPDSKQGDVIRAILITTEAVARSHREEKIRAFARLLISGLQEPPRIAILDEFDDYVSILDEVSWREWQMMAILSEYEDRYRSVTHEPDYKEIREYWDKFVADLTLRLGIPAPEASGLIARLGRTGLYEVLVVSLYGGNVTVGTLTGTYYRLAEVLHDYPTTS